MLNMTIGILLVVMAIFLVIAVLMQSSKDHRLGASVAGAAETFFGKTKGKSYDALFSKLTTIIAIIFVILVIVLYVIQPDMDDYMADLEVPEVTDNAETPVDEETPAEETPAEETPAEETPAEETPAEETPAEEVPAEETPVEETPAEETPAEETPAEETPAAE